ncbi:MAG: transporter [Thermodesulfobacteriota bacterium]
MISHKRFALLAIIAFILIPCLVFGQEVSLPPVNLGQSNFLDGIAGYYLNQITPDKVDGHTRPHSKEEVFAVGPGLMYSRKGFFPYLNAYYETRVENRPEGKKIAFRFSKVF